MTLDVAVPEPPDLSNRGRPRSFEWEEETLGSEDFYREDIEDLLQEGAWKEGFNEWTEYTDLDETQVRAIDELGLFRAFDFYQDPDGVLGFDAPTLPDDWRAQASDGSFGSGTRSLIDTELQELGRAVYEMLEGYLETDDWTTDDGRNENTFDASEE